MLIVQKYGGSSVADTDCIMNVARRVLETKNEGNDVVVVLSAQGDTTDELIQKATEITQNASKREMDMLLSTGEQQSCALLAIALRSLNCPAVSLNAYQAGIFTSSTPSNARIKKIYHDRITAELKNGNVVVVTGFQGYDENGDVTTLGRGASDTTAVAIAASLDADACEIYTDVNGVFTADPKIVEDARLLYGISHDEMLELASSGAKVLHNRSVELAKKCNINLTVRSSFDHEKGTVVCEECGLEEASVSGIAVDKDVSVISVIGIKDIQGAAYRIFSLLADRNISVDIILQSIEIEGRNDIFFTVSKSDADASFELLLENKQAITAGEIIRDDSMAKVSIVGAGMTSRPGVASAVFKAMFEAEIKINLVSTSETKISVLVDENMADDAMVSIHNGLGVSGGL